MLDGIPTSLLGVAWRAGKLGWKRRQILRCWASSLWHGAKPIRVSCAHLIRIQYGNKFLLVPSSRIPAQMQPPGGVVQTRSDGEAFLRQIGAHRGDDYSAPDKDHADLRIHVPGRNLMKFLGWYMNGGGREATPAEREFREELVETEVLPHGLFEDPKLQLYKTTLTGPRHTDYFGGCTELLLHQFFNLSDVTDDQGACLRDLQAAKNRGEKVGKRAKFGWYTSSEMAAGGWFPDAKAQHWKIGDHARWMI